MPVACLVCRYINIQKVFIFRNDKEPGDVGSIWKPHPVHITAWSYFFGAIAMIITAVVGFYAELGFLKFGKGDPEASFNVPTPMFVGLAYAVFISSGALRLRRMLCMDEMGSLFRIDGGSNQPLDTPGQRASSSCDPPTQRLIALCCAALSCVFVCNMLQRSAMV